MMKSYDGACAVEEETSDRAEELNYKLYAIGQNLRFSLAMKFPNWCPVCKRKPSPHRGPHEDFCILGKFYDALDAVDFERRKEE